MIQYFHYLFPNIISVAILIVIILYFVGWYFIEKWLNEGPEPKEYILGCQCIICLENQEASLIPYIVGCTCELCKKYEADGTGK